MQDSQPGFFISSVRKAIENVDDPQFKNKYGQFIPFFQVKNHKKNKRNNESRKYQIIFMQSVNTIK